MKIEPNVDLTGKVIFVTGGSGILGRVICEHMARCGAKVSFLFKDNQAVAEDLQERMSEAGLHANAFQGDVRDRTRIGGIFRMIENDIGPIDTLVHAAFSHQPASFEGFSDREWDLSLAMNIKGVTVCTQEAFPFLKKHPSSSLTFVAPKPRDEEVLDVICTHGRLALMHSLAGFGKPFGCRSNAVWVEVPPRDEGSVAELMLTDMAKAVGTLTSDACLGMTDQTLCIG